MSFRIFAAGTTNSTSVFNYNRAGLDIGDIYDGVEALGAIASSPGDSAAALEGFAAGTADVLTGQVTDAATATSPHQQAVTAMGRLQGVHLMVTNFTLLCVRQPLHLFISVQGDSGWFSYSGGTLSLVFDGTQSNPASYLLRRLTPLLEECDLNGFGVLHALAMVFMNYDAVAGRGAYREYRLNIDIRST